MSKILEIYVSVSIHHVSVCARACQVNTAVGGALVNDLPPHRLAQTWLQSPFFFSRFTATSWKITAKPSNCVMSQMLPISEVKLYLKSLTPFLDSEDTSS